MGDPHSPTAPKVRASTLQQSEVAPAFAFSTRSYIRRLNAPACLKTPESE